MAAATSVSRSSHGFPSPWANSAPFSLFHRCSAPWPRRGPPPPRLPLSHPSLWRRPPLIHLRCSPSLRGRCRAAASPPPEPPFGEDRDRAAGLQEMFYRMNDAVRIFFAVFFWMSLFFWASAWDGRDDIRPNKRPPFRR